MSRRAVTAAVTLALLVCLAACSRKKAPVGGIGEWKLNETTLGQAPGFCNPDESITMCSHAATIGFGGQSADIHLYFRGSEPDAPLVEISVVVKACDPEAAERTLTDLLGAPVEKRDKRAFWRSSGSFVAAQLPAEARRCEISFVAPDDADRIAELTRP